MRGENPHLIPIRRTAIHVPPRIDVDPVRDARVDVREDAAVGECVRGRVDVECVSASRDPGG